MVEEGPNKLLIDALTTRLWFYLVGHCSYCIKDDYFSI